MVGVAGIDADHVALGALAHHSLWAHLRKLVADGRAMATDVDDPDATWTFTGS